MTTRHGEEPQHVQEPKHEHRTVNERAYRAAIAAFVVSIGGGALATVGYWTHGSNRQLGVGLALTLGGIGFGLVSWAKYLDLDEHVVQERESLRLDPDSAESLDEMVDVSRETVTRRPLLLSLIGAAIAALVAGFVGPLASLGPSPKGERKRTGWAAGKRLVTADGRPILAATARYDQLATVFPDGDTAADDSQVVLLQVQPDLLTARTVAAGSVQGWVAYSKICTHAGCSVGLFGVDNRPPRRAPAGLPLPSVDFRSARRRPTGGWPGAAFPAPAAPRR